MNMGRQVWVCVFAPLFLAGFSLLGGCSTQHNSLTMASLDRRHDFNQTFSHAYAAFDDNGDYDIVLVHDAAAASPTDGNGAVRPAEVTPRQVVHIRVFWIPERGAKMDHPVATNAAFRWYVFGDRADDSVDYLEYSGSALVMVSDDGKTAWASVRGAILKLGARQGDMADPLGPSTVTGDITALVNRQRVDEVLNDVKAIGAGPNVQAASGGN
ncbi:MAG: hypothetical protein ABSH22_22010 [Tepidisphaeraceae bacterium]